MPSLAHGPVAAPGLPVRALDPVKQCADTPVAKLRAWIAAGAPAQ